jgi:hypothetical protein
VLQKTASPSHQIPFVLGGEIAWTDSDDDDDDDDDTQKQRRFRMFLDDTKVQRRTP